MRNPPNAAGSRSDVGCVRTHNEDSLIVQPPLYAVADGMGGHAAGEVASEIAIDTLAQNAPLICDTDTLIDTVHKINQAIIDAAATGQGRPGMGTTLTAAILDGNRLLVAQVGDSRAYLLHNDTLQQLTRDHSYVGELLAGGHISEQEAAIHPKRSVITRALGSDPKTEADIYEVELALGDRLLLCSDGLSGMVSDQDIQVILAKGNDPQSTAEALIKSARLGGGLDNISAIVVDVSTDQSQFLQQTGDGQIPAGRSRRRSGKTAETGRRFHLGVFTFALLFVLLIAAAVSGTWFYAQSQAYLTVENGYVAVYRGLPGEGLPWSRALQWPEYTTDIDVDDLNDLQRQRLTANEFSGPYNDIVTQVANMEQQVNEQKAQLTKQTTQQLNPGAIHTTQQLNYGAIHAAQIVTLPGSVSCQQATSEGLLS
jgi:protein phosphatase